MAQAAGKEVFNQDFKVGAAWSISSGHRWSRPGALPGFRCWRAAANSSEVNSVEMLPASGVGTLQRSVISFRTDLSDSRSLVLCVPFFTSCEAMAFAETGYW